MEEGQDRDKILERIANLRMEIAMWSVSNSQSSPGAVFQLRSMKREILRLIELVK